MDLPITDDVRLMGRPVSYWRETQNFLEERGWEKACEEIASLRERLALLEAVAEAAKTCVELRCSTDKCMALVLAVAQLSALDSKGKVWG